MAQNGMNKTINKKQQEVAEKLVDPEFKGTITELCKLCDVPRRTFYNWRNNPDFCRYVDELIEKYTDSELAAVWKALIRACLCGNVQAIRLFFELKNKFKENISTGSTNEYDALTSALKKEAERLNDGDIT